MRLRLLVQRVFQSEILEFERMSYGHSSVTFAIDLPGQPLIARCHPDADFYRGTLTNLDRLRSVDVPVPAVLHTGVFFG